MTIEVTIEDARLKELIAESTAMCSMWEGVYPYTARLYGEIRDALTELLRLRQEGRYPVCEEAAESMIPRLGMSWACALEKGHEGPHRGGGNCFRHGRYIGAICPSSPLCGKGPLPAAPEGGPK